MTNTTVFPPRYSPQPWLSEEGTTIMRGPVATATDCVWTTEVCYLPSKGKWKALIPFTKSALLDTAADAVAWIESHR
jgi:hypothetical protein